MSSSNGIWGGIFLRHRFNDQIQICLLLFFISNTDFWLEPQRCLAISSNLNFSVLRRANWAVSLQKYSFHTSKGWGYAKLPILPSFLLGHKMSLFCITNEICVNRPANWVVRPAKILISAIQRLWGTQKFQFYPSFCWVIKCHFFAYLMGFASIYH